MTIVLPVSPLAQANIRISYTITNLIFSSTPPCEGFMVILSRNPSSQFGVHDGGGALGDPPVTVTAAAPLRIAMQRPPPSCLAFLIEKPEHLTVSLNGVEMAKPVLLIN